MLYRQIRNTYSIIVRMSRDSVICVATSYGLEGKGIKSRWRREFRNRPDRPWDVPSLLYNCYRVIPREKAAGALRLSPTPIWRRC